MFKILKIENISIVFILPTFAIGSFYDERLEISGINLSIIFSIFFILGLLFQLKNKSNSNIKSVLFLLILSIITFTFVQWTFYEYNIANKYSFNKLIVLTLITFPISFFITNLNTQQKIKDFLILTSAIGLFLSILGVIQVITSGGGESRLSVLGGGPIVFSRWVGFFMIVLIFIYKLSVLKKSLIIILCISLMILS